MTTTQAFWLNEYAAKAGSTCPFVQSGRASATDLVAFLHSVRRMATLLAPQPGDTILDVGCANGLMAIVLSGFCRQVVGVERVEALANLARTNTHDCGNVDVICADATQGIAPPQRFDRALVWEALQLMERSGVRSLFNELSRCVKPGGKIVLGSIPDARRRSSFQEAYLTGVRASKRLSDDQKQAIVARNERAEWYDADELVAWWAELGGRARVLRAPAHLHKADHRFDLVVDLEVDECA